MLFILILFLDIWYIGEYLDFDFLELMPETRRSWSLDVHYIKI